VAGKARELVLIPFADARAYRVWLMKPASAELAGSRLP